MSTHNICFHGEIRKISVLCLVVGVGVCGGAPCATGHKIIF